jgi:hypothetical protein
MSIDNITPQEWNEVNMNTQTTKKDEGKSFLADLWNSQTNDEVNHPSHYNNGKIECIEAIEAASTQEEFEGYLRGNVLKYVWRFKYKDNIKDLRKARWYLDKLIEKVNENVGSES